MADSARRRRLQRPLLPLGGGARAGIACCVAFLPVCLSFFFSCCSVSQPTARRGLARIAAGNEARKCALCTVHTPYIQTAATEQSSCAASHLPNKWPILGQRSAAQRRARPRGRRTGSRCRPVLPSCSIPCSALTRRRGLCAAALAHAHAETSGKPLASACRRSRTPAPPPAGMQMQCRPPFALRRRSLQQAVIPRSAAAAAAAAAACCRWWRHWPTQSVLAGNTHTQRERGTQREGHRERGTRRERATEREHKTH